MTNGEKIQQMFPRKCPHIGFNENFGRIWLMQDGEVFANFTLKWWNSEYKEPTKNDLGVDAISRADARKAIIDHQYSDNFCEEHNIDHSINTSVALLVLADLPSVTPQEPKTKIEESNFSREQYALDIDTAWKCGYEAGKKENSPVNICPHCGEYIGEEE